MMRQRIIGSFITAALITTSTFADDGMLQRFEKMEKEMADLKAELNAVKSENSKLSSAASAPKKDKIGETLEDLQDQIDSVNKRTKGNNIKWDVDFRTSFDNLQYTMADGSKEKNDALLTNRLWLGMSYSANKNLSFIGQLSYYKIYGDRSKSPDGPLSAYDSFDWVSGESAHDDALHVRSAYFLYADDEFLGTDIPWTFSIGRRPSTGGHLANLREDISANSPLAHAVNVEFDGASAKFGTDELLGLTGSYFKLCAGRGMTNAEPRFNPAPYATSGSLKTGNVDMAGIIVVPYDDKQYSSGFQYTYANNLIDIDPAFIATTGAMETTGGLHTATAFVSVNGIGDGISDFLDNTIIFASGAMSKTDPYKGAGKQGMLGSFESETGYSYWIGTQFPSLISEEGRWGVEFNHGSQYWRPITHGEDTLIGSKIATRGDAYEAYFTEPLVDDVLTFQLRYTYIDYKYSGSNGFFGTTSGTPYLISETPNAAIVDKAQNIRAYIRYKF